MDSAHEMSFHHYPSVPARGHGCQKERVKRVSEVQSWFHFEDRKKKKTQIQFSDTDSSGKNKEKIS